MPCSPEGLLVEFRDTNGQWQALAHATAVCVELDVYEITISKVSQMWLARFDLFDGLQLRINGRNAKNVVSAPHGGDRIVLTAIADPVTLTSA